jgi:molybdate transport system permease protein
VIDLSPIWLTLRLAAVSTIILLLIGTPLAWWLACTRSRFKAAVEAIVAIPVVLPPTVLGFYLLICLGPHGLFGGPWHQMFGYSLAFTFTGLVIGSVLYSMPFVVQPIQNAFESTGRLPMEAAATLRASPLNRFFTVALPSARRGFVTAVTLGFAHTVGEFGVVLMIGGNIPHETRVLSIAIYDHVEAMEYQQAHVLSAGLLIFSFLALFVVFLINRRWSTKS